MRKLFFPFVLLALSVVYAEEPIPQPRDSGTHFAQDAVMPYVKSGACPGAISVLYKKGVQEVACMGWAHVEKRIPIAMDQLFMICSQTKAFCGVCVAMLVEEKRISLDDPVYKYLPEFKRIRVGTKQKDGSEVLRPARNVLTIRHVMTHTGGLPFETPMKDYLGWPSCPLRITAFASAALPFLYEPGTSVKYSNAGIDIGAAIVEVVTGMKFDRFLKERVLDPLGMKDTTFKPTDEQLSNSISLYGLNGPQKPRWVAASGAMPLPHNGPDVYPSAGAGLWSTANDLLKFYKMLMFEGRGENGVRILKEETVKNLLATNQRPKGIAEGYSLGLFATTSDSWFGHGGAWCTYCNVNGKEDMIAFWVVQTLGGPRPWERKWGKASNRFFSMKVDDTGTKAYTGRMQ